MKRIIIKGPGYCAVTEDGFLTEYIPTEQADQCGDILLGKIGRMMPGMKCAFADIGRKKNGFLPLDEESSSFTGGKIFSGETIILQIKKEETGEKGAYLTRDITLPGSLVILMPMNRYVGVSHKIRDEETRERLKEAGMEITGGQFGLILRNASAEAETEAIRKETERLRDIWEKISENASESRKPGMILWTASPLSRLREDYAAEGFEETEERDGPSPEIVRQMKQASERKLPLPGGGNIVIDRCEAMTVIDVNTASAVSTGEKGQIILETNLEACALIARQVRLRNLSGIILIDFIDMDNETDRSLVFDKLSMSFRSDRIKTVIHGWTRLGIMEMTRKRTRQAPDFTR